MKTSSSFGDGIMNGLKNRTAYAYDALNGGFAYKMDGHVIPQSNTKPVINLEAEMNGMKSASTLNNYLNIGKTNYKNILYLERPGCNLCMGNQEKAAKGNTVMATSTRLFKGRVVEDSTEKKGESLLASTPVVVLSAILGRAPTLEEYKNAVEGIDLTSFSPPMQKSYDVKSIHF